jgi:hypothetical protein
MLPSICAKTDFSPALLSSRSLIVRRNRRRWHSSKEIVLRGCGHECLGVDPKQRAGRSEHAGTLHDDVSVKEILERIDSLIAFPDGRHKDVGLHLDLQNGLADAHDVESAGHSYPSRPRRCGHQVTRSINDFSVDPSAAFCGRIRHPDALYAASQNCSIGVNAAKEPAVERVAVVPPLGDIVKRDSEQVESGFIRRRPIVPECALAEEIARDAPKGRRGEVKERCGIAIAIKAEKSDVGRSTEHRGDPTTGSTGVPKAHSYGVQQRPLQIAQQGSDQVGLGLRAQPFRAFNAERTVNSVQDSLRVTFRRCSLYAIVGDRWKVL